MTRREYEGWLKISRSDAENAARNWERALYQPEGEGMARIHSCLDGIRLPSGTTVKHMDSAGYMVRVLRGEA